MTGQESERPTKTHQSQSSKFLHISRPLTTSDDRLHERPRASYQRAEHSSTEEEVEHPERRAHQVLHRTLRLRPLQSSTVLASSQSQSRSSHWCSEWRDKRRRLIWWQRRFPIGSSVVNNQLEVLLTQRAVRAATAVLQSTTCQTFVKYAQCRIEHQSHLFLVDMQDSALFAQTGSLPWGVHVQFVAAELTWFFDYLTDM